MHGKVFGSWTRLGVCFKHKKLGPFEENAFWAWMTLCKFPKMANFDNAHLSQF